VADRVPRIWFTKGSNPRHLAVCIRCSAALHDLRPHYAADHSPFAGPPMPAHHCAEQGSGKGLRENDGFVNLVLIIQVAFEINALSLHLQEPSRAAQQPCAAAVLHRLSSSSSVFYAWLAGLIRRFNYCRNVPCPSTSGQRRRKFTGELDQTRSVKSTDRPCGFA